MFQNCANRPTATIGLLTQPLYYYFEMPLLCLSKSPESVQRQAMKIIFADNDYYNDVNTLWTRHVRVAARSAD